MKRLWIFYVQKKKKILNLVRNFKIIIIIKFDEGRSMNCKFCGSKKVKVIRLINSPFCKDMNYFLYDCEKCLSRFFDINQYNLSIENFYNKRG